MSPSFIAHHPARASAFRTSSHSIANGDCVEVAGGPLVRDSKDPDGPVLSFSPGAWQAFTEEVRFSGAAPVPGRKD